MATSFNTVQFMTALSTAPARLRQSVYSAMAWRADVSAINAVRSVLWKHLPTDAGLSDSDRAHALLELTRTGGVALFGDESNRSVAAELYRHATWLHDEASRAFDEGGRVYNSRSIAELVLAEEQAPIDEQLIRQKAEMLAKIEDDEATDADIEEIAGLAVTQAKKRSADAARINRLMMAAIELALGNRPEQGDGAIEHLPEELRTQLVQAGINAAKRLRSQMVTWNVPLDEFASVLTAAKKLERAAAA